MRRINIILFTILINCALAACSATSPAEDALTEASMRKMDKIFDSIMTFNNQITLPPIPNLEQDRMTVAGVDADRDGTRDFLQHIASQATAAMTQQGITVKHYYQVLALLNMIQPPDPPVPNSIDRHKIYCAYQALPSIIKGEHSLKFMHMAVLNSQKRDMNFYHSVKPSVRHLEEEPCD